MKITEDHIEDIVHAFRKEYDFTKLKRAEPKYLKRSKKV
jgi:hypothetical protein